VSVVETITALAVLGLASAPHCALMCGPLALRGCRGADGAVSAKLTLGYVAGRLSAYLFVGALAGSVGAGVLGVVDSPLRVVAIELIAVLLLSEGLNVLMPGRFSLVAWAPRPSSTALSSLFPTRGVALGMATGFLPCGALLAALLLASSSASAVAAGLGMASFALVTLPGVFAPLMASLSLSRWFGGGLPKALREPRALRRAGGIALVLLSLWVGARPLLAAGSLHSILPPHTHPSSSSAR